MTEPSTAPAAATQALPPPEELPDGLPARVLLVLDAWDQFNRAVDALPVPGQGSALGRLNAGRWIVAHVAEQQDQYWNVAAQHLEADPALAEGGERSGSAATSPLYDEARTALRRVQERALPFLLSLTGDGLPAVVRTSRLPGRDDQNLPELLDRSAAHLFAHAGELATIASLVGAPDLGLPGQLRYSRLGWHH